MERRIVFFPMFLAALLLFSPALFAAEGSMADNDAMMPQEQVYEGVHYMTGGIGLDERAAMSSVAGNYTLKLMFAVKEGNYVSDVGVVIRNAKGDTVLRAVTDGPWMLVKLGKGDYKITASYGEKNIVRNVKATGSLQRVVFAWKD